MNKTYWRNQESKNVFSGLEVKEVITTVVKEEQVVLVYYLFLRQYKSWKEIWLFNQNALQNNLKE